MTVREHTEQNEQAMLSEFASKSAAAVRKDETEPRCDIRTEFQRDRDRIIHCKAFRRLMHKTQVFISPEGDHFRTRLTHTLEVSQIARTISRALRLNEDLTEAIALGHDLGHTPFGHLGEEALDKLMLDGFRHNEQSIRVAEKIEKQGRGLNLTLQVLDGILNHRGNGAPETLEGKVVQISDKIAYINHDIDDAMRAGILTKEELPKDCVDILGDSTARRIDFLVRHIVTESFGRPEIVMLAEVRNAMGKLRQYLFENLYLRQGLNERKETSQKLYAIYDYFMSQRQELPKEFLAMIESGESVERVVCDFIACMTDRYAEKLHYNIAGVFDKSLCKNY